MKTLEYTQADMDFIVRMCLLHNPKVWGKTEQEVKNSLLETAKRMLIEHVKKSSVVVSTGGVSFSFWAIDGDYNKLHVEFMVDSCMFYTGCEDFSKKTVVVFESDQERIRACLNWLDGISRTT